MLSRAAIQRWLISMAVGRSSGGNHAPLQRGQWSPHPMPEPVMRTIPPKVMSATERPVAVHAKRRSVRVESLFGVLTGERTNPA